MHDERIYQLALTQVPQIGCVAAKMLVQHFQSASEIFKAKASSLSKIDGIGTVRAEAIKSFNDFSACEHELAILEKEAIDLLFVGSENYPKRLMNCYDSPTILFYKGSADLNQSRTAAVIGTRSNTEYGKQLVNELVEKLAEQQVLVVSGLAFGIDTLAHRAALKFDTPTVGVMANGFSSIYPSENQKMARQMMTGNGGLLTEFFFHEKADRHNFPIRNRIVAGLCDVTIVVETDKKGGSMITAELASNYNRDVVAFPGKTTDIRSRGCNYLIQTNTAGLVRDGQDVLQLMQWLPQKKKERIQRKLFVELSRDENIIAQLLASGDPVHIDVINLHSGLNSSSVAAALLSLELQGIIASLPGKRYQLL